MTNKPMVFDAVFAEGQVSSYRRLIQAMLDAGLAPVLYREYAAKPDMRGILLLRHDVDSDLDAAVNMAAIEFQMGIRSTFFLLPPGDYGKKSNYYGRIIFGRIWHSRALLSAVRRLVGYGHEVGLHNDFVHLSRITGRPVATLLREELAWFRNHDIPIRGSASHGSEFAKKNNFVNYEIFKGCERRGHEAGRLISKGKWRAKLHEVDMGELGLSYEAYFLPRDFAYSDSSKTVVLAGPNRYKAENLTLTTDGDFQNLTTVLKGIKDARFTALVHPNWWTFGLRGTDADRQNGQPTAVEANEPVDEFPGSALLKVDPGLLQADAAGQGRGTGADSQNNQPTAVEANKPVEEPPGSALLKADPGLPQADAAGQGCGTTTEIQRGWPEIVVRNFLERNPQPSSNAMLPFEYLKGLYKVLLDSGKVKFLDFRDLPFLADQDIQTEEGLTTLYKQEYRIWRNSILSEMPKLHFLIMHDSDSGLLETQYLCAIEGEVGIKSTTSIFCRQINAQGDVQGYNIDYALLKRLQDEKGMCFAYHCNAPELSGYDEEKIANVFNEDVEFLQSKGLDIRFFSPHGGKASPKGFNNNSFFYPSFSRYRLIWTHNRFAPSGARYSDGGLKVRLEKGDPSLNLQEFLTKTLALDAPHKNRYFMLLHPQYYFGRDSKAAEEYFPGNPWLKEFWSLHMQGKSLEYWNPLRESLSAFADMDK